MSYTIEPVSSNFVVKNPSGGQVYSSANAQTAMSTLFSSVPSGGTAYFHTGLYPQSSGLNISKAFTIDADLNAIIQRMGTATDPMLVPSVDGIRINRIKLFANTLAYSGISGKVNDLIMDGIEVKDTSQTIQWAAGITFSNSASAPKTGLVLRNSYIHNTRFSGIVGLYCPGTIVDNNLFDTCGQLYPSGGAVALQDGCDNILVQNNTMQGKTDNDGAYLGQTSHPIVGAKFLRNKINLTIFSNLTKPGTAGSGVKLYGTGDITDNVINWNNAPYIVGISPWGHNVNILRNTIMNAKYGIGAFAGTGHGNHIIDNNTITGCTTGIYLEQSGCVGGGNVFSGNGTNITGTLTPHSPPSTTHTTTTTTRAPTTTTKTTTKAPSTTKTTTLPPVDPCADIKAQLLKAQADLADLLLQYNASEAKVSTLTSTNLSLTTQLNAITIQKTALDAKIAKALIDLA